MASHLQRHESISRMAIVYRTNTKGERDWLGVAILVNHGKDVANVQVFVRPDERRKGYGTALVKAVIRDVERHRVLVCDMSSLESRSLFGKFEQFKVMEVAR